MPLRTQGKRINPTDKKRRILYALSLKPMSRKELGELLGWHRLHEFLADLTSDGFIQSNLSTKRYELTIDIMVKG